ncbi:MAG: hypothetical protein ACJAT5_001004, partial [Lentimonas sp.]
SAKLAKGQVIQEGGHSCPLADEKKGTGMSLLRWLHIRTGRPASPAEKITPSNHVYYKHNGMTLFGLPQTSFGRVGCVRFSAKTRCTPALRLRFFVKP